MTESNSVRVSVVQRTSFSTAAALNMLVLPVTAQSLRNRVGYQQSQTIRTDANVQDLIRLSKSTGGGLPFELTFPVASEAFWFLLRAALRSTETAAATEVTSVTSTSNVLSAGSGNVETGVEVGDIMRIRTAANALVGFGLVTAVDTGAHTVTINSAVNIPDAATTYKVQRGARMKNGTERYYFDAEIGRLDANLFELFRKIVVNGFSLNVQDGSITSASFDLLGVNSERSAVASLCLGHTAPTAGAVLDALGVPTFAFNGTTYSAKGFGISVNNNIAIRTQIASSIENTISGFSWGAFTCTTRSSSYLANWVEMGNYTDNVPGDFFFVMQNASGQALSFSMSEHKWSDLGADTRGLNQDDYLEGSGQAYLDPIEACTLRVQRWA